MEELKKKNKIKYPNLYGVDLDGTTMVMEEQEFFAYKKALKDEMKKKSKGLKREKIKNV